MNIIMHYPKSKESVAALQNKISDVHAEAVVAYLQKLTCPPEQKVKLLESISTSETKRITSGN